MQAFFDMMRFRPRKVLPLVVLAVVVPTTASDAAPYTATGTVGKVCTISKTSLVVTVATTNPTPITTKIDNVTNTSATAIILCNAPTGGRLTVSAVVLTTNGDTAAYPIKVTGWGADINPYTAGSTAVTRDNAVTKSTVTIDVSGISGVSTFKNNRTYTSTITLGVAPL